MPKDTQRSRDIARAAMLRERIVGAVKASTSGMTAKQLCDWPSIVELYHGTMLPGRVQAQLGLLVRQGIFEKAGSKPNTTYFVKRKREGEPQPAAEAQQRLSVEVDKTNRSLTFIFEGVEITIKVRP